MTDPVFILALAYLLDLAIGDPRFIPHPVVVIGRAIQRLESLFRKFASSPAGERAAGTLLVFIVVAATWGVSDFMVRMSERATGNISVLLGGFLLVWFTATTLATRGLMDAACRVITAVRQNDMEEARKRLADIVGRDTSSLDERKVLTAAVETLAENASDGIIAPLFYYMLGGLPFALTYKAINTLDSMLGYRNARYQYFGWAAARLDDIANFVPARLTAALYALAAIALPGASGKGAIRTVLRDGRKHLSPNSGMPEAAMAGALGVSLGGPSTYHGVCVPKPFIGDDHGPVSLERTDTALRLTFSVSLLGFLLTALSLFIARGMP